MSISVDDLVSSFSSSHIGQEALDLAALQAQLSQTLFGQPLPSSSSEQDVPRSGSRYTQPCNTPTATSSFNWAQMSETPQRQMRSNAATRWDDYSRDGDDMEEDERMVEDLLIPSSPMSAKSSTMGFSLSQSHVPSSPTMSSTSSYKGYAPPLPYQTYSTDSTSLFASTDPFYIAQSQAQSHTSSPQSFFSQSGRPSTQSPFIIQEHPQPSSQPLNHQRQRRENYGYMSSGPAHLSLDTHTLYVSTSAAFER